MHWPLNIDPVAGLPASGHGSYRVSPKSKAITDKQMAPLLLAAVSKMTL
jgi:hypothetical protein